MSHENDEAVRGLIRQLAETEAALQQAVGSAVDTVIDPDTGTAILREQARNMLQIIKDEADQVQGLVLSLVNVTERIRTEQRLRENEEKLLALFEILPVGVSILDSERKIRFLHGSLDSATEAIREGVDAYLLKPVRAHELRQTVRHVLARREERALRGTEPKEEESVICRGGFEVDQSSRRVSLDGTPLELTTCEFDLLFHLMRNHQRVVPSSELVDVVRGYACSDLQEARDIVKWYIYRLRRKVEPNPSRPRYILNVRGVGYTFKS